MSTDLNYKRSLHYILASLFLLFTANTGWPQTEPVIGLRDNTPNVHALVNARIVQNPYKVIENGTIIIREGIIEDVGRNISIPEDAKKWNCGGKIIYPGFIESYSHLGVKDVENGGLEHWNKMVKPEISSSTLYSSSVEDRNKLLSLGFTSALIAPKEGVFRGSSILVSLGDKALNEEIIRENIAQHLAFERASRREYPNSLMGSIALMRQTFLDTQWYLQAHKIYNLQPAGKTKPETNNAYEALQETIHGEQPILFETNNHLDFLRAVKIAKEFGLKLWICGSGYEYKRLELIKAADVPVILPINFPVKPAVEIPEEALNVDLSELLHWEVAPVNPKLLHEAGIEFALTTSRLDNPKDFYKNLHKAIKHGLPHDTALAALTTFPAKLFGVESRLGTLENGKLAHLIVSDGRLFHEKSKIMDVWINGNRYEINKEPEADPQGTWKLTLSFPTEIPASVTLEMKGKPEQLKGNLIQDGSKIEINNIVLDRKRLAFTFSGEDMGLEGIVRLSGHVTDSYISGKGELPNGEMFSWIAEQVVSDTDHENIKEEGTETSHDMETKVDIVYPFGAFGRKTAPEQPEYVLVQNATLWTLGEQETLNEADLLISNGKITQTSHDIEIPDGALVIDAQGKHVTPGLIDCHTHLITDGSFNETGQTITAECRISDVLNSSKITIYRNLAGGLTTANIFHGSANPIGGQSAVVKLRWGAPPDELLFSKASPGIKFALGENVKQSNWGDRFTSRYPQTRMGVEQIIRDRFKAALDYEKRWNEYTALANKMEKIPPRRDLELEALLEVLQGKRKIHCHAYRQDEMLMLIRLAEEFGFTLGTFQHTLEGYKIAEALAEHGVGASAFSDWWAYKFEVFDSIPYGGALMHKAGVLVSFNSDTTDGELSNRLNTEAAKAVKYGGVNEVDALKFVTLNAAKQLGIDDYVGSLEKGKDADFVIWSGPPLSTYSHCEQTWIEGCKYFDKQEDERLHKKIQEERARLIQKILKPENNQSKENNDD